MRRLYEDKLTANIKNIMSLREQKLQKVILVYTSAYQKDYAQYMKNKFIVLEVINLM